LWRTEPLFDGSSNEAERFARTVRVWSALATSSVPADRAAAEAGVADAYREAGLTPPKHTVWCEGPRELARLRSGATFRMKSGDCVASEMTQGLDFADATMRVRLRRQDYEKLMAPLSMAQAQLRDTVVDALRFDPALPRDERSVLTRLYGWLRGTDPLGLWYPRFTDFGIGQYHGERFIAHDFVRQQAGGRYGTSDISALGEVVRNVGLFIPYRHIAVLVERHASLALDDIGRLHAQDGPAMTYRDGWQYYAWKGVGIQPWMIDEGSCLTLADIERELDPAVRHCMVDIVTPEVFVRAGHARRVADDEYGTLWRHFWRFGGSWAAVEVANGTPEPDGSIKRYFLQVPGNMQTPLQAVAWTYGMTPREYRRLSIRT